MTSLDFVKELVNAFNVSNYGSKVNTNFVVEGDNIVVKFNCDRRSAKRYLSQMARDLVREYYSDESVARYAFDLGSFPFHFDKEWLKYDKKTRMTKLTVPIDSGVIFNLKVHFAEEFKLDVKNQVIKAIDEKHHLGKKHIEEILNASIGQVEIDSFSGYIKCLLFNSPNLQTYFIRALQEQIKKHGYNYSGFYDIDDNKVYFKDVENIGFVRSVTETSKKKTAYNFNLQGVGNLKVKAEHYKGAMGELIFRLAGVSICGYYRDNFISEDRISNGDRFAFIPMVKEGNSLRYLNYMEANKINAKFSHDLLTNVRGQTKDTESNEFGEVYALSDRQIALLIPVIIENSVINKDGQIEIDPGLRFQALSRSPSTELSDMELESPTRSPDGALKDSPRQGSEREKETEPFRGVLGEEIGQASTSSQQTDDMPRRSYTSRYRRTPLMSQPSTLRELSLSEGADESMLIEIRGQQVRYRLSLIPSPRAWKNSMSLNSGVSEDSLKDTENIYNEEPEKQQVTDKSDRKSSDEYSEAKSQDSKSPEKKHGDGLLCSNSSIGSMWSKLKGNVLPSLRRNNKGRGSVYSISSSVSAPVGPVTKKPPGSKSFLSFPTRKKAKSNPPSEVTSPTHEGASGGLKPLTSDERKELCKVLSPEMKEKLNSNSFSPGKERLLYLTHTPEEKRELSRFLCESKESQLRRLAEAQLLSPDNSSSKRDSGYSSGLPASPAAQHKGSVPSKQSVPSEVKECEVEPVSEALRK